MKKVNYENYSEQTLDSFKLQNRHILKDILFEVIEYMDYEFEVKNLKFMWLESFERLFSDKFFS